VIARTRILLAIMLTILSIFVGRLIYLQLAQAEAFDRLSVANFLEERRISPLRGRILARDGTIIADSRVAYDLMYLGGDLYHSTRLGALLDIQIVSSEPDPTLFEDRRQGIVLAWNIEDPLVAAVEELVAGQENLYLRTCLPNQFSSPGNWLYHRC
jgi:cell division protein FtsI/penicillin-binding protein 2